MFLNSKWMNESVDASLNVRQVETLCYRKGVRLNNQPIVAIRNYGSGYILIDLGPENVAVTNFSPHAEGMLVTAVGHGYNSGDKVIFEGQSPDYYISEFKVVSVIDSDNFVVNWQYRGNPATLGTVVKKFDHGFRRDDSITISGTTSYDGTYTINWRVDNRTVRVSKGFVADEAGFVRPATIGLCQPPDVNYMVMSVLLNLTKYTKGSKSSNAELAYGNGKVGTTTTEQTAIAVFPAASNVTAGMGTVLPIAAGSLFCTKGGDITGNKSIKITQSGASNATEEVVDIYVMGLLL